MVGGGASIPRARRSFPPCRFAFMKFDDPEAMAQALFEETGDAMFLFDPDNDQILDANSTAQRLTGFSVRELLRLTVKDLVRAATDEGGKLLQRASRHTSLFHSEEGYFL